MRLEPAIRESNLELAELKRKTNKEKRNIEKSYDNMSKAYLERTKKVQEEETNNLNNLRNENKILMSEENMKKAQTFHELSDSIAGMRAKLDQQKEAILFTNNNEIEGIKARQADTVYNERKKNEERLTDLTYEASAYEKKFNEDKANSIYQMQSDGTSELSQIANAKKDKFAALENKFSQDFQSLKRTNEMDVVQERAKNSMALQKEDAKYRARAKNFKAIHDAEMERIADKNKADLKMAGERYAKKANQMSSQQAQVLSQLDHSLKTGINDLKNHYSTIKENFLKKSEDIFYRPAIMDIDVKDRGKFYALKLFVPPHEKDSVQISGNVRNVRISMSRNFREEVLDDDKSVNRSNRHETFVKEINVDDIINDNLITKNYDPETQLLTFHIPKR